MILGFTFKENCPDLRNTRVIDIVNELKEYNISVDVYDPWISVEESQHEYGITPIDQPVNDTYDGVILAVAHRQFAAMGAENIHALGKVDHVLYDLKYVLPANQADLRL